MIYENYPELECVSADIGHAVDMIADSYKNGGKLMTAGNGGSASDSEHIVGELMKGFKKRRPVTDEHIPAELAAKLQGALPAVSLSGGLALPTAYLNDVDGEYIVAQTLYGLAKPGDTALLISTSGNAKNLCPRRRPREVHRGEDDSPHRKDRRKARGDLRPRDKGTVDRDLSCAGISSAGISRDLRAY